jgi:carboxymethylenebutenolidase
MPTFASIPVGASPMDIMLEAPARTGPGPAVVLMYHREGYDDFTRLAVKRLADAGYLVAVPDVSHRTSRDVAMPDRKQYFKDSEIIADIRATIAFLRNRPDVAKDRLVIMGHCMGGRMTLLGAGRVPEFRAAVVYYGGGCHLSWGNEGATPMDTLKDIRCPVIGFFGGQDKNPSPEQVDAIDAELSRHGIAHTFHRYPDVGHGFQNPAHGSPAERAAAEDGWSKTFRFLETMGLSPAAVAQ